MKNIASWLKHLEQRQPTGPFKLGLERMVHVLAHLDLQWSMPIITVAGTNGKGSCCCYLENILIQAAYRPGCFYSPHLLDFTERIRVAGTIPATDDLLDAFATVEAADAQRSDDDTPLSYFEFIAIAAALVFQRSKCTAAIFEVGLGGRLDAVNAFDADVAVITSIGIDHVEHLGPDRESIGAEKAGIMRPGRPVIIGDSNPPASILAHAAKLGCPAVVAGRDFNTTLDPTGTWCQHGVRGMRNALPRPLMHGRHQYTNASCALAALEAIDDRLPVDQAAVRFGLAQAALPARFEVLPGPVPVVLDVAHNVAAARALADALFDMGYFASTHAVFGARKRKDIAGIVAQLAGRIEHWYVAPVGTETESDLATTIATLHDHGREATVYDSVAAAAAAAHAAVTGRARIVVTGSFLTVEEYLHSTQAQRLVA